MDHRVPAPAETASLYAAEGEDDGCAVWYPWRRVAVCPGQIVLVVHQIVELDQAQCLVPGVVAEHHRERETVRRHGIANLSLAVGDLADRTADSIHVGQSE